jgi:Bacterial Ig domain
MRRFLDSLPARGVVLATLALMTTPTLPAWAQSQGTASATASAQARLLNVDLPARNAVISNGSPVEIAGWTAGSRVDVYLDGPAGVGAGIGSAEVHTPRLDARSITGITTSGFDLPWQPTDLSAGPHTLHVYSLTTGWIVQTVPILGAGNALPIDYGWLAPFSP